MRILKGKSKSKKKNTGVVTDLPEFTGLDWASSIFLYTFRNSMGDFLAPNYDDYITIGDITDDELLLVGCIWIAFLSQAIISVIILLNFLIAVISKTYENVLGHKIIYTYIYKAEMNLEYYTLLK